MTNPANYNHDLPRLAEESGFTFELNKGRVSWSDIENLNIQEITEYRNFQLLEQSLVNVLDFNPEKDFNLRVLDKNYVKLFKLAQLGIDYLSYCGSYLDKCVILLQEQLLALQEECDSLKQQKNKRTSKVKNKRKKGNQSYKCEKCDKVFISDVYLKCHYKRRHGPQSLTIDNGKNLTDRSQQTELSMGVVVVDGDCGRSDAAVGAPPTDPVSIPEANGRKSDKIDDLEREIQDLKIRLKRTELALNEKTEKAQGQVFRPPPAVVPDDDDDSGHHNQVPKVEITADPKPKPRPVPAKRHTEDSETGSTSTEQDLPRDAVNVPEPTCHLEKAADPPVAEPEPEPSVTPKPFPRRLKKFRPDRYTRGEEPSSPVSPRTTSPHTCPSPARQTETPDDDPLPSTPKSAKTSNLSLNLPEVTPGPDRRSSNSFLRKMVSSAHSPRVLELRKTLKRSFVNLYDSVSGSVVTSSKSSAKAVAVDLYDRDDDDDDHRQGKEDNGDATVNEKRFEKSVRGTPTPTKAPTPEDQVKPERNHFKKLFQGYLNFGARKSASQGKKDPGGERPGSSTSGTSDRKSSGSLVNGRPKRGTGNDGGGCDDNDDDRQRRLSIVKNVNVVRSVMYGSQTESDESNDDDDDSGRSDKASQQTVVPGKRSEPENPKTAEREFDFSVFQVGKARHFV